MKPDRARALLPLLVNGELGPLRRWLLARHLARCPSCMAALEELHALRTAIRTSLTVHRAPPDLAARIGAALPRELPPPQPVRSRRAPLAFGGTALAGCAAGIALTLLFTHAQPTADPLEAQVVASHVRSLLAEHLTDVPSSDRHMVKPWLTARLDFAPMVRDLGAEGFPLLGGRLDYLDGHDAAAVVYRRDRHIINLFMLPATGQPDAAPRLETRRGFNIIRWRQAGLGYVAVSDVEAAQLETFVHLLREP